MHDLRKSVSFWGIRRVFISDYSRIRARFLEGDRCIISIDIMGARYLNCFKKPTISVHYPFVNSSINSHLHILLLCIYTLSGMTVTVNEILLHFC